MPIFEYTASDRGGSLVKGEIEARNKNDASKKLAGQGMFVLEVHKSTAATPPPTPSAPAATAVKSPKQPTAPSSLTPPAPLKKTPPTRSTAAPDEKVKKAKLRWPAMQQALYLRQLSVLYDAGVPLYQAAAVVGDSDEHSPNVKKVLMNIPRDLERGRLLSKSLERSGLFGKLVVSSVKLGEESGRLDEILRSLAEAKEAAVKLRRVLISRLTYPIVVLSIMSVGLVVLGHVMGRVMSSLPNFDPADVPLFGFLSRVFQHQAFLPVCFLLLVGLAVLARKIYLTPPWRMAVERQFLAVPTVGMLLRRLEANSITSQLSILISAGLPIDRGLKLCSDLVRTEVFRQALLESREELLKGAELSECFKAAGLFPDDVLALVTSGEISGMLEESLSRASEYCSGQVERTLETLLALLEPLLIGFLGIAIGGVLLCTFVPVFNSLQTM